MTARPGWFILLTSLLSFWRVKRWERGILQSTPSSSLPPPSTAGAGARAPGGLLGRLNILRTGLGFQQQRGGDAMGDYPGALSHFGVEPPTGGEEEHVPEERERNEYIIPIDPNNPEATDRLARAYAEEARLQRALRAAGLL